MINLKCPNCNKMIPKKWIILGGSSKIYKCSNCGTKLKWNKYNLISTCLGVISANFAITYTKDFWMHFNSILNFIISILITLLIVIGCNVIFLIILPNSISIEED